jgi:hypothetical protein
MDDDTGLLFDLPSVARKTGARASPTPDGTQVIVTVNKTG